MQCSRKGMICLVNLKLFLLIIILVIGRVGVGDKISLQMRNVVMWKNNDQNNIQAKTFPLFCFCFVLFFAAAENGMHLV